MKRIQSIEERRVYLLSQQELAGVMVDHLARQYQLVVPRGQVQDISINQLGQVEVWVAPAEPGMGAVG